ncbi:MAG: transporter substrate-binding domain-containing protein, partial [Treponema sp.]|nr:transporter substrate-binding domain-containing protein [Treponema sp.]
MRIRNIDRTAALALVAGMLVLAWGCKNGDSPDPRLTAYPVYSSYRDIPGVSGGEIEAIEAFREQGRSFVYGMNESTESFYDEYGVIHGYSALFCGWLSHLFGIPFTPGVYEWGDLIAGLESGRIDFTGELTANDERRKLYFMTDAIAERSIKFMRLMDSEPLSKTAEKRPLRYAFLEGTTTHGLVSSSMTDPFETFLIDNYETAYAMLKDKTIDAFFEEGVAEAAFDAYGDVRAEDFFPLIYGEVSFSTQNPALEPFISVVQKALHSGAARHLISLYNQGHQEYMRHKLFTRLTEEEKAYIREHAEKGVPIAVEYDNYPVCFYNTQENEWQGIAVDVLEKIETLTGLTFTPANGRHTEWPVLMKMLEDGEVSMLSELIRSNDREHRFIWTDESYQTDYYALLSSADFPDISVNEILYARVGLIRDTAYAELFLSWFPNHIKTTEYASTEDAFAALERGDVDLVMATRNLLLGLTNYRELAGYKANIIFNRAFKSSFGFNRNETALRSIVDKSL